MKNGKRGKEAIKIEVELPTSEEIESEAKIAWEHGRDHDLHVSWNDAHEMFKTAERETARDRIVLRRVRELSADVGGAAVKLDALRGKETL